ncbi:thiamine-phosphate diphosphorylase [Loigolactobacillus backii]|uniref:thiamine phosphate synthase n=1 Tax=Loigolactobacillus TaxID=2767889 RepID=UPI000C1CA873|nr:MULTISPECIES: thiamine phosphate synthase [Loigolactobacillus]PIO82359.1 thiamine-phosphate diphosphorylase [Loigolactobacillus backii]
MQKTDLAVYFVAGSQDIPAGETLLGVLEAALSAGITTFQYREKGSNSLTSATAKLALAQQARDLCANYKVPFIVDDDVDLALAVKADGIHVGQKDETIQQVIQRVRGKLIVGLSCNTLEQVKRAQSIVGIDYLGIGPIFSTTSKADAEPEIGIVGLKRALSFNKLPSVAIGGIDSNTMAATAATGVDGLAVISLITHSPHRAKIIAAMRHLYPQVSKNERK